MSVIPITSNRINSRSATTSTSRDPDAPFDLRRITAVALQHPYSAAFLFGSSLTLVACSGVWLTKRLFFPSRALGRGQISRSEVIQVQNRVMERLDGLENRLSMQLRMVQPDKNLRKSVMGRMQGIEDQLEELSWQGAGGGSARSALPTGKTHKEIKRMDEDELKIMEEIHFARPKENDSADALNYELAELFGLQEHEIRAPTTSDEGRAARPIEPVSGKSETATVVNPTAQDTISSSLPLPSAPGSSESTPQTRFTAGNPDKGYAVYKRPPPMPFGGLRMGLGKHGPMPIVDPSNPNYM